MKTATATAPKREMMKLATSLPAADLLVFRTLAEHFGTTPEAIMQCEALGQLNCIFDSPFRFLAGYDECFRNGTDMVPVQLTFVPEAHSLLETTAAIVRRPLPEFVSGMLISFAETLASEAREAVKRGGFDESVVVVEMAEHWLKFEFEARRGRVPVDTNDFDCWTHLEMENLTPPGFRKQGPKGGVA